MDREAFDALVARLSRQSVDKHFEAYADVAWDELTADEPLDAAGLGLWTFDPLGRTAWYQAQSAERQAEIGLHRIADVGEGEITSGSFSPTLSKTIALARVPMATADRAEVEIRGKWYPVRVVKPTFVRHGKTLI